MTRVARVLAVAFLGLMWAGAVPARADIIIDFVLTPGVGTGYVDGSLPWSVGGTITNLSDAGESVFLSADFTSDMPPGVVWYLDASVPLTLAPAGSPGDSYTGPIFWILKPGLPVGVYTAWFTMYGGANPGDQDWAVTQSYTFNGVHSGCPEPSTLLLIGPGLALFSLRKRRRNK